MGAQLARDEGVTYNTSAGFKTAIASKLCSHRLAHTMDRISADQSSLMVMFGIAGDAASCNTIRAPTWRASS